MMYERAYEEQVSIERDETTGTAAARTRRCHPAGDTAEPGRGRRPLLGRRRCRSLCQHTKRRHRSRIRDPAIRGILGIAAAASG